MPGRMYVATFTAVAVSAAQDLFEIVAGSGKPVVIHAIYLAQTTDEGDAQSEMLGLELLRGYTTSGSGGSAPTPRALNGSNSVAAAATVEVNNTTQANTGTVHSLHSDAWNVQAGWQYVPPPEQRIELAAGERLVLAQEAPADAITMRGTLIFEELG